MWLCCILTVVEKKMEKKSLREKTRYMLTEEKDVLLDKKLLFENLKNEKRVTQIPMVISALYQRYYSFGLDM